MYHTGCDVHDKSTHLQHMDSDGALGLSLHVPTTPEGFSSFLEQLDEPTSITLEAGRNYFWLHEFLKEHPMVYKVNVIDPRRGRKLAEELSVVHGYGRAKNDRIDAEMAAHEARLGLTPSIHVPTPQQLELRTLVRHRMLFVWEKTATINRIHGHLAMHGAAISKTMLQNSPDDIKKVLASVPDYVRFIINQLRARMWQIEEHIPACEEFLERLLPGSHPQIKLLLTAPGIGLVLARIIYAEILDIAYFKGHYKYLMSYSGLAPVESESAGKKGVVKLNHFSNHFLKYAFVEAAHHARTHHKYRRKYQQDVKKHGKIRAKLNLARRLVKAVYWMLARQQPFKA
ncbi:MAG: IS110 family transposase [bacterium]